MVRRTPLDNSGRPTEAACKDTRAQGPGSRAGPGGVQRVALKDMNLHQTRGHAPQPTSARHAADRHGPAKYVPVHRVGLRDRDSPRAPVAVRGSAGMQGPSSATPDLTLSPDPDAAPAPQPSADGKSKAGGKRKQSRLVETQIITIGVNGAANETSAPFERDIVMDAPEASYNGSFLVEVPALVPCPLASRLLLPLLPAPSPSVLFLCWI